MRRLRVDVSRPESPIGAEERAFLVGGAVVVVVAAQLSEPGSAGDVLVVSLALAAFVLRAVVPAMPAELYAALVIAPVTVVVSHDGVLEPSFFLSVTMVLYTSWHLGSTSRAVLILGASAAMPWLVSTTLAPEADIGWVAWTAANGFTFALGRALRRQQILIEELEAARSALAEQAVAEERRRMARELHDLAGHTLAAVLLHVTGARHVLRRHPDEAERALADAEAVGRSSLDQIRSTVAALRTHERGTDPALAASADLGELVDEYRRAGLVIDATITGAASGLDGPVGIALHRIAREALANVARHAPQNCVVLTLDASEQAARLVVRDRGQPATTAELAAGHFGLVGMRERARALGGELHAGPTADGWEVEACVPVMATAQDRAVST